MNKQNENKKEEKLNTQKSKNGNIGTFFAWIFSALFILMAINYISKGESINIIKSLVIATLLFPLLTSYLYNKFNISIHPIIKIIIIVLLFSFIGDKNSEFYNVQGTQYYKLKEYVAAEKSFSKAIELDPTNKSAVKNKAMISALLNIYSMHCEDNKQLCLDNYQDEKLKAKIIDYIIKENECNAIPASQNEAYLECSHQLIKMKTDLDDTDLYNYLQRMDHEETIKNKENNNAEQGKNITPEQSNSLTIASNEIEPQQLDPEIQNQLDNIMSLVRKTEGEPTAETKANFLKIIKDSGQINFDFTKIRAIISGPSVDYAKLFYKDALLSLKQGQPVRSAKRNEYENYLLDIGVIKKEWLEEYQQKMKNIAYGLPIISQYGEVVVTEEIIIETIKRIDEQSKRLDLLLTP